MQWHPPHTNISQPLPFGLERRREGTAFQALSPRSTPGAHSPSEHRTDTHPLTGAGKQPSSKAASSYRAGKLRHNLERKNPTGLFEPKAPGSILFPAARAGGTGTGTGIPTGDLPSCMGGWPAPRQHLQRGTGTRPERGARPLEGFVPAWGHHAQPQACQGKSPLVSHLKTKNLEK